VARRDVRPSVSFVVTVHNEERRIGAKLENTLRQDYPRDRLEVLVASDGSTDRTDEIVRSLEPAGVRLVRVPERGGKEAAQRRAIAAARGEILVFSDAATMLAPDGVARIVRNFADSTVGCASSVDRVVDRDGRPSGEGLYVRYEMLLRRLETRVGSVVGLSGSFFAARREVCADWPSGVPSDFVVVPAAVRRGLRGVLDEDSVGYYPVVSEDQRELQRKVRTVLRGITAIARNADMLNPVRYGAFSLQLWSHKVGRWLVPLAQVVALATNIPLLGRPLYDVLFALQLAFYAAAAVGLAGVWPGARLIKLPAFLVLANVSIAIAWYRFLRGQRVNVWTPSQR
jgi:glycosyltransferase involved in cell wall biosynthesis